MKKGWITFILIICGIASSMSIFTAIKTAYDNSKDKDKTTTSENTAQVQVYDGELSFAA